jgi:predicted transposase YdaD
MREQDERGRVVEEKTKKANTLEIAKKFKLAGIDNNTIANSTGLSIEEIDKL